jgi:hypothetical protein
MIPKIIWQTHENKYNDLLPFQKDITNTWKNLNPGCEYRYVDAEERSVMVKEYSEFLYKYYLEADNVSKADIWRLIAIYTHGGFYADMDSICIETIQDSMDKKYKGEEVVCSSIGFQHPGINNSNFGAIKNSKIIQSIIYSLCLFYNYTDLKEVNSFNFGWPENHLFSTITQKNKNLISFNNDYFMHSLDYKAFFNSHVEVIFNKQKANYHNLCIENNWEIYSL